MNTLENNVKDPVPKTVIRRHKAMTILVIEDEPDIQNFVSRVLELEGYHVLKVSDGATGMQTIKESPIDLVLLDLRLPDPDGWAILHAMKHSLRFSKIPVVVITAVAESAERQRTLRMGATQYLVKPLSAHSLIKAIAATLNKKAASKPPVKTLTAPQPG